MALLASEQIDLDAWAERRDHAMEFLKHHTEYSAVVLHRATVYRSRSGLRREFLSEADAMAYDIGYGLPADATAPFPGTPCALGFADAANARVVLA